MEGRHLKSDLLSNQYNAIQLARQERNNEGKVMICGVYLDLTRSFDTINQRFLNCN